MSELQKTIDALYPIALALADHWTGMYARDSMDTFQFKDRKIGDPLVGAWTAPQEITFRTTSHAEVILKDIRVESPRAQDVEISDPIPTGPRETIRSVLRTVPNDTDGEVERELEFTDGDETGSWHSSGDKGMEEAWASVAAGLEQQAKYGDAAVHGVEGETKISLTAEAGFKKAWERETAKGGDTRQSHSERSLFKFTQKPFQEHQAIREEDVGPVERRIVAKGKLAFRPTFHAPGVRVHDFPSMRALQATMQGHKWEEQAHFGYNTYRGHPITPDETSHLGMFVDVFATVEHVQKFDKGENKRTVLRARAIDPAERLKDALAYIAENTGNAELARIAKKEIAA